MNNKIIQKNLAFLLHLLILAVCLFKITLNFLINTHLLALSVDLKHVKSSLISKSSVFISRIYDVVP